MTIIIFCWISIIQIDHVIEARRMDFVIVDRKRKTCEIVYFSVHGESRIEEKEKEKEEKYQDQKRQLQIWNARAKITPLFYHDYTMGF